MSLLRVAQRSCPPDVRRPQQAPVQVQHHRYKIEPRLARPERVVKRGLAVVVADTEGASVGKEELQNRRATSPGRQVHDRLAEAVGRAHVHAAGRERLKLTHVPSSHRLY